MSLFLSDREVEYDLQTLVVPAQRVSRFTGISPGTQRAWRKRAGFPTRSEQGKITQRGFSMLELAWLVLVQKLNRFGVPIEHTGIAQEAAVAVLHHAFSHHHGAVGYHASPENIDYLEGTVWGDIALAELINSEWNEDLAVLDVPTWGFLASDGMAWELTDDLNEIFSLGSSFTCIDLCRLAGEILDWFAQPFIMIRENNVQSAVTRFSSPERIALSMRRSGRKSCSERSPLNF